MYDHMVGLHRVGQPLTGFTGSIAPSYAGRSCLLGINREFVPLKAFLCGMSNARLDPEEIYLASFSSTAVKSSA